jgi:two-component system sensor histidine kinase SenX3
MSSGWSVLLAVALGLGLGLIFMALVHWAERRGHHAVDTASTDVPDGVAQVIQALDSVAIVVDPSNNVVSASTSAQTHGFVTDQVLLRHELLELVELSRSTEAPVRQDIELALGPFGDASIHLSVQVTRLGSRYILMVAEDTTDARRLEDVRRDFIANISHELKTPIGAIGLLAEALEPAADDPAQVRRFASRLGTEATRLSRITREIIDLSRLQATDALASAEMLSVDHLIASALDQNHVLATAHRMTLVKGGTRGVDVFGDEALLILALHNLISNAIQYSGEGSRVGIGVAVSAENIVEIAVTDQGVGIPTEDQGRVFERFFRVDQSRSRNTGGTGLGLSIVKHVVQNHGGDVRIWSQVGRGSTFTIRLPKASGTAVAAQGEK